MSRSIGLLLIFILFALSISAQNVKNEADFYSEKYPGALGVRLIRESTVTIDIRRGELEILMDNYEEMLHLAEQSWVFTSNSVYHSGFTLLKNLNAHTLIPVNKRFRKLPVTDFIDVTSEEDGIFYHDSKERKFTYPGVTRGAHTVLSYQKEFKEPRLLTPFFFQSRVPGEKVVFRIKADKNVNINYKLISNDNFDIQFHLSEKGKYRNYTWEAREIKPVSRFNDAPAITNFSPHLIFYIESYSIKGENISILPDLSALNTWYWSLINDVQNIGNEDFTSLINAIVDENAPEEEKVKAIYYWVQRNIRYIAFSDGMGGFVPNHPLSVLRNRYGDCKDKSALLHNLLYNAGIKSHLAWVGTRDKPYSYNDIHTPIADNHMIVVYKPHPDETVFLDATQQHGIYGLNPSNLQGKEVLVSTSHDSFFIDIVPVVPLQNSLSSDTAVFSIFNDKDLYGQGTKTLSGYSKFFAAYGIIGKTKQQQDGYMRKLLGKGGRKYHIENYSFQNLHDKEKDLKISYYCRIEDYVSVLGDEIFVNMNLERMYDNDIIDTDRRDVPIENEYNYLHRTVFTLESPAGYFVASVPQDRHFRNEKFGYQVLYTSENNRVTQFKEIFLNTLMIEQDDFTNWNDFMRDLSRAYRETVVLKRIENKN